MNIYNRYNRAFENDSNGRIFAGTSGDIFDLSRILLLMTSVDTVRQIYSLIPRVDLLETWAQLLEESTQRHVITEFQGHEWVLRRGGKAGYAYLLQNAEYGIVLLVKSNYRKADQKGSHVKIELSPKLISAHCPESMQQLMDDLALSVSGDGDVSPAGVAVHLALDVQGWEPPKEFSELLVCRSRKVSDRHGFTSLAVDGGEVSATYGKGQSFCFGSASSLQFAVYNKSKEALAHDKWDYFEQQWRCHAPVNDCFQTLFDPVSPVWRLEARFAHSVVNQFAETNGVSLKSYASLVDHLGGLWQYALKSFRLDRKRDWIDPAWQLFLQDARFVAPVDSFEYRRTYKTPGMGNEKNVMIAFGNMLSVFARNRVSPRKAWNFLKKSGIWMDLRGYCRKRDVTKQDLFEMISDGLKQRRLASKVAA